MAKGILHSIRIVSFLTVLSISLSVKPQAVIVSGSQDPTLGKEFYQLNFKVLDNFTGIRIPYVNAYLMTTDSVVVDSVQDKDGNFSFKVKRDKAFRSCIIKLTHPDYQTVSNAHSLKSVGKQNYYNLPDLFMKRRNTFTDRTLDEVVVTATKVKMYYRGDTIVYNADAFNVADGSMLDALIRQMPGTELNKNGEIFVNGRKIDNLLLNGKDLFRGNNKLMLENLPYYTVKEIKVYDQTPEKAMVLRDETAEKEYVMDVNLKKEYSKGYMANVEVGAGTEDAYLARLFGLRFTDVSHMAIVGGMNNLNMGDYTFSGYAYDSGAREGRTTSNLLTATLLTEHKRSKNQLTVELNRKKSERGSDVFEEIYHNENSTFSTSQNSTVNRNIGVSLANTFTLKMPFWMQSQTKLSFNNKKDDSDERYYESGTDTRQQGLTVLDSLFCMGVAVNDPSLISARKRWMNGKKEEYSASQYFNISQKLYSGDLIDFTTGVNYTKSTDETDRFNRYLTWNPELTQIDIEEDIDRPNTHVKARADLSYKISRLFYGTDMRFFANYTFNHVKDRETILDAVSLVRDIQNSYHRQMNENKYDVGMNYTYEHLVQDRKLRTKIELRLPLSITDRRTNYNRYTVDTCLIQSPVFFEPSLTFTHSKWRGDNARNSLWKFYASSSLERSLPDATLLITLPLTSDKINIYQGNEHLKSPTTWRSELSWNWPMKKPSAYLEHSLKYTNYFNRIINTYRYDAGVYTNQPENIDGTWDIEFTTRGQQFANISKLPITINYNLWSRYQRMKNYVADGATGQPRQMDNNELTNYAHIQLRTHYKDVSGGFRLSTEWRKPLNDREDLGYRDTWDYKGDFWLSAKLPLGIDWETECGLIKRQGYSNEELNKLACEWDMKLSKSIFKNKIGLSLKAIDILHQYKRVAYVVNERGIRETRTVSLPAYWLFSVTYKFNKQPKKK
jgi:hypothetical protein